MRTGIFCLAAICCLSTACGDDVSGNENDNQNQNNVVCGDGVLDPGEQCDNGSENSDAVPDACRTDCRFAFCGDGTLDADDECDGSDLGGLECADVNPGLDGGDLGCGTDCTFDLSQCTGCGNGTAEGEEVCDGTDVRNETCQTNGGFASGALGCAAACDGFDTSGCYTCGNGIQEGAEDCDASDVGTTTCADLSHDGGSLACDLSCGFDVSDCHDCGDGVCDAEQGETSSSCQTDCGWVELSAGIYHFCGLRADGSAWCWGKGLSGQLGNGAFEYELSPVRVQGLSDVVQVVCGEHASCARTSAGAVYCWGANSQGQLGNGTNTDSSTPVQVAGISGAADIGMGFRHACAALQGGALRCWGWNSHGQLGDGTLTDSAYPVVAQVAGSVTKVSGGVQHTCALVAGSLWCWGDNGYGQLGNGGSGHSTTPVQVGNPPITDVIDVDAGRQTSCAVRSDHTAWCWGRGSGGVLGDGTEVTRRYPVQVVFSPGVPLTDVYSISGGYTNTCASTTSGTAYCWGGNYDGSVGDTTVGDRANPSQVAGGLVGVMGISTNRGHSCAWTSAGEAWCWGRNANGELGRGDKAHSTTPVPVTGFSSGVSHVTAGYTRTCAVFNNAPQCWGKNASGELGQGSGITPTERATPVAVLNAGLVLGFGPDGESHNCALESDGDVWCWGRNYLRQLSGTGPDTLDPVQVSSPPLPINLTSISTGGYHNCVRTSTGDVWCWGRNANGECGLDSSLQSFATTPNQISASGTVALSAGQYHNCIINADTTVSCWGRGTGGQLGNNTYSSFFTPQSVFGGFDQAVAVAAGHSHSCALKSDGTVWCWGQYEGVDSPTPLQVPGLTDVTDITAGWHHACALKNDKTVWCWGRNTWGTLGDGTLASSTTPVQVLNLGQVASIDAGLDHTCAQQTNGALFCWGNNAYGQLGNGLSDLHPTPALIAEP